MEEVDYTNFGDELSFYVYPYSTQLAASGDLSYDFDVVSNMPSNIVKQSSMFNQAFPPVDGLLYSPVDGCYQLSDLGVKDASRAQDLFNDGTLMSKLETQSTTSEKPARYTGSSVDMWQPAPETKRRRPSNSDSKSACWTSSLCPAHGKSGPHPNPSTCEGGCAPNVFDEQSIEQWLENFSKDSDGVESLEMPNATRPESSPNLRSTELRQPPPELDAIKEEAVERSGLGMAKPHAITRSAKRTSSESSASPDPAETMARPLPVKASRRQP